MDDPGVEQKVETRVRIPREELLREQIAFASVAGTARGNEVAGRVSAASGQWLDVVQRRRLEIERRSAIDAPAAAVPQRRALEGTLVRRYVTRGARATGAKGEEPRQSDPMRAPDDMAKLRHL